MAKQDRKSGSRLVTSMKRRSSRKRKSEIAKKNPLFLDNIQEPTHSGFLKTRANVLQTWKKRWHVLHGTHLSVFRREPTSASEAISLLVDSMDVKEIEEVKVEKEALILKLKKEEEESNGKLVRVLTQQKSRAQQFLRRGTHSMRILQAESDNEAQEWMNALLKVSNREEMPGADETEMPSRMKNVDAEEVYITSMKLRDRKKKSVVFSARNLNYAAVPLTAKEGGGKRMAVKQLVGTLPSGGFLVDVEMSNGCAGTSMTFQPEDFVEYDEEKQIYDDTIDLNFTVDDDYQVFLVMERGNLAVVSANSQEYIESVILRTLLENDKKLLLAGFAVTVQVLTLLLFRSIWSILLTISIVLNIDSFLPTVKSYLLEKLQPYFISSLVVKKKAKIKTSASFRKDESITNEEYELLVLLRESVSPLFDEFHEDSVEFQILDKHINTDYRLVRFLRARNNKIDKATKMVKEAMEWRLSYGVDNIIEENIIPEWLLDYSGCLQFKELVNDRSKDPFDWFLRDKDFGNLATIVRSGGLNQRKILKKLDNDVGLMFHYIFWTLEFVMKELDRLHEETNGKCPSYLTLVLDLKHFSHSNQLPLSKIVTLARKYLPIITTCYPELLQRCTIINAPVVFYSLWNVVSKLLPERVLQKIQIKGSKNNFAHINRLIDISEIPASYGGKLIIDGDEMCHYRIPGHGPFLEDKGASLLAR